MIPNLVIFYGEELLAHRPTPKQEDHPLSAVRDCLFKVFAATLHKIKTYRTISLPVVLYGCETFSHTEGGT
jgi:hypothetical protein